jgi:hypothetical protein
MNQTNLSYICSDLLEIDWKPRINDNALQILDKCDSKLETMFLVGALYFLDRACIKAGMQGLEIYLRSSSVSYNNETIQGICIWETWPLWIEEIGEDVGPQSIMFVPQLKFGSDYHQDFGIFYGANHCNPNDWRLMYGAEVDGYKVHKKRRKIDQYRDSLVNYSVIRLLEEVHNPLTWFKMVMEKDSDRFHEEMEKHAK